MADRVLDLIRRQRASFGTADPTKVQMFDKVYADEVQDSTMAELAMLAYASGMRAHNLFLAGDTAQAVTHGVAFRFEEVRSLLVELLRPDETQRGSSDVNRDQMMAKPIKLTQNFR
jgi:hypothetical protein